MSERLERAVAMFIFNRPETTAQVFQAVRQARPKRLLVVADGPRAHRADEPALCAAARAIVDGVDWPCEVLTNYADRNLGIRQRMESGLDWVFDTVDEAIVLEDDIVPDPTFFPFCDAMLQRYRMDHRVSGINGSCFIPISDTDSSSYHFSRYPMIWGWATWARAWRTNDPDMRQWPELEQARWLYSELTSAAAARYWSYVFRTSHRTRQYWDYAWVYSCWRQQGLMVTPNVNLTKNIGFGDTATHTRDVDNPFANLPTCPMIFPLRHPAAVRCNQELDELTESVAYSGAFFVKPMFAAIREHLRSRESGR